MKHEHTRTFEQQARIAARHQEFHVVPADWCPACRALKAEDAKRQHPSLRSHIPALNPDKLPDGWELSATGVPTPKIEKMQPVRHKVTIRDRGGNFTRLVGDFATWQEADAARRDVGPLNAGYFVRTEVVDDKPIPLAAKCPECGRTFDLLDEQESEEMAFGHDCEAQS